MLVIDAGNLSIDFGDNLSAEPLLPTGNLASNALIITDVIFFFSAAGILPIVPCSLV